MPLSIMNCYIYIVPLLGMFNMGELHPAKLCQPSQIRISLPRHNLLGEKRLTSLSEENGLKPLSQWAFIGFSLHRNTGHICKAHQSLSGSNDQGIDSQRIIRTYSESGSDR